MPFHSAVASWKLANGNPTVQPGLAGGAAQRPSRSSDGTGSVGASPSATNTRITISPLSPNPRARQRARTGNSPARPLTAAPAATATATAVAPAAMTEAAADAGKPAPGALKLCCWQCYQLVAKEAAHKDARFAGKPFCSAKCADAFMEAHQMVCALDGCVEEFIKSSGMCVAGEWYCGGLCAEKGILSMGTGFGGHDDDDMYDDEHTACASPLPKADMSDFSQIWAVGSPMMAAGTGSS